MKTSYDYSIYWLFAFLITAFAMPANTANAQWSELGGRNTLRANNGITTICKDPSGNTYAAGTFTDTVATVRGHSYVAKWNDSTWTKLGGHALAANSAIFSICSDPAGNIYAAGGFTNDSMSNTGHEYVAKWDGRAWSELGGHDALAANNAIWAVCTDLAGNIYAAGAFTNSSGSRYVAKWDGSHWSELGGTNALAANHDINTLCSDAAGNIYAAGSFYDSSYSYYVAKWDGSQWSELGGTSAPSLGGMTASICSDPAGNIYAAGYFTDSLGNNCVFKWNGSVWSLLGSMNIISTSNFILSICSDPSGNIYAGGGFRNSLNMSFVARYDGSNWTELGGNTLAANGAIWALCSDQSGNINAGGFFTNGNGNCYVAEFSPPTGIAEIQSAVEASLYPNPAANLVTVSSTGNIEAIGIFDQAGALVQRIDHLTGQQQRLSTGGLAKGIYYVQVTSADTTSVQKLVVE